MIKVLIVDDEADERIAIEKILDGEGYEVISAASGKEAIEKVKTHKPQFILLDIHMPQMDGFQVLQDIREIDKQIVVMMMAGSLDSCIARRAIQLGAVNYLTKPVDPDLLKSSLLSWAIEITARQFGEIDILVAAHDEKKLKTTTDIFEAISLFNRFII